MQSLNQTLAFCNMGPEDKPFLGNYPGEEGFSPRKRLATIVGAAVGTWAALLTPLLTLIL